GPRPWIFFGPFGGVHIACLTSNEGFIYFYFAAKLARVLALHREPSTLKHEPSSLLSDADAAVNLPGANTILGVHEKPHHREPLIKSQRRIFENSSGLKREFPSGVLLMASPDALAFQIGNGI